MGLVDLACVGPLLHCPRCRAPLIHRGSRLRCSSASCRCSCQEGFPQVGRWPVLIDFEGSVVTPDGLRAAGGDPGSTKPSIDRLPRWLRPLWKPPNRVAAENVGRLRSLLPGPSPLIVVIGGATMGNGLERLYADRTARLIGFDIYASPLTQFIADAHRIPLAAASVDGVIVQAVLEHVLDPAQVVTEIHRVLRPDGLVYAETPFMQQVHAGPYDFVRFTGSGHRYLFRAFEEISAGPVTGPGTQLLWSMDHLTRALVRSKLAGRLVRGMFAWLRWLDPLADRRFALDGAGACYFLGRRAEHELRPSDIVGYYQGAQRAPGPRP
jgi:SAM-dependent methyltransferase